MESISGNKTLEEFKDWIKVILRRGLSTGQSPPVAELSTEAPVVVQQQESTVPPHTPQTPAIYDPPASESSSSTIAQDKGKAKALPEESSTSTSKHARERIPKANSGYVDEQRKLKLEAQAERERIRKLLEADKVMKAMRGREVRERESRVGQIEDDTDETAHTTGFLKAGGNGLKCALSFRLLDGSSLKHKFPAEAKLGIDVRKWIDQVLHLIYFTTSLI